MEQHSKAGPLATNASTEKSLPDRIFGYHGHHLSPREIACLSERNGTCSDIHCAKTMVAEAAYQEYEEPSNSRELAKCQHTEGLETTIRQLCAQRGKVCFCAQGTCTLK